MSSYNNNNSQQKEREPASLPGNFPRFSVQIPPSPQPGQNSSGQPQRVSKLSDTFQGFSKRMENTATKQDDDSISVFSEIPKIDESALNETINKELSKERKLILQYVNLSLNDHTTHIKELTKDLKDQQIRNKDIQDKQSLMMRQQIAQFEQNYKQELDSMNYKFTKMIADQKQIIEQTFNEKENRLYSYCNDIEKRLDAKISNINQRLSLQIEAKDNKLNDGQFIKKLDADIQNINHKIQQIQSLQNLDEFTGFNSQLATFSNEIQSIKNSIRKHKDELDQKILQNNQATKELLMEYMGQNQNNLMNNQNDRDKIFEGQIEVIQKYINGFSKIVQNKLNITSEDLNLFIEKDNNNNTQQQQNNPFSFGGGYNQQQTERVSTLGTMQSAEFEVKENSKIVLKNNSHNNSTQNSTLNQQQNMSSYQQSQQQSQSLQYINPYSNQRNSHSPTTYSHNSSQNNNNINNNNYNNSNINVNNQSNVIHSNPNIMNSDYYNIYQEMDQKQQQQQLQQQSIPMTSMNQVEMNNQQQQQQQKKKKRIFGDETNFSQQQSSQQQSQQQSRQVPINQYQNYQFTKPEQKNLNDSLPPQPLETHKTESDYVEFGTMPNKDSFQSQQNEYLKPEVLESKLSVKFNDVEVYDEDNGLSDGESDDQQSDFSNFRLKDTMNFIQREIITNNNNNSNNQSQQQLESPNKSSSYQQQNNYSQPQQSQQSQQQQLQQQHQQQYQQYQEQQNQNLYVSDNESLIKFSQVNQSSPQGANHKRLNTIQESEQEYSSKKDNLLSQTREDQKQKQRGDQDNLQQIGNFMTNKIETLNNSNKQLININSNNNYSNEYKLNNPNVVQIQQEQSNNTPSNRNSKRKFTSDGKNFMMASKGKSNFNQVQSNIPEYPENDDSIDYNKKWGYDSQMSRSDGGEEIEYILDEEGYLLDEKGQFLLDDQGQKIQLTQDNINFLQQNKMIYDA